LLYYSMIKTTLSHFIYIVSLGTDITYAIRHSIKNQQPHSCNEAALGLIQCLENLDCVKMEKKPMIECLKDPIASDDCRAVRNAYTMCKHSQLNMRTRIRGVRTY
jgi:hypothetical protein